MLEEIEFHRLAKLRLEVDEPEELCFYLFFHSLAIHQSIFSETYGRLFAYDKTYNCVTTKTEKPLQLVDCTNTIRPPLTIQSSNKSIQYPTVIPDLILTYELARRQRCRQGFHNGYYS